MKTIYNGFRLEKKENSMYSIEDLKQVLNPNAFTFDSVEGIVVISLIIFAIFAIGRRMIQAFFWCLGALILLEVLYSLSLTSLNDTIPISKVIKYDVVSSIAQLFPGTKLADWILTGSAWLRAAVLNTFNTLSNLFSKAFHWVTSR